MKNFVIPPSEPIDEKKLSRYLLESVQAFSDLTGISVTFFDRDHALVHEIGRGNKPCHDFELYDQEDSRCRQTLTSAAELTSRLGEPYIFLCQAGLTNIAVSLLDGEKLYGCFIAGPIAMGGIRKGTLRQFRELNQLEHVEDEDCRRMLSAVPTYPPRQISQLALMFYNGIISAVSEAEGYRHLRRLSSSQSEINDSIRESKQDGKAMEYPYDLEAALVEDMKDGDMENISSDLDELIHRFSILDAGNLERVRTKVLWLFAILLRTAAEREQELNLSSETNLDIINPLSEARDLEELSSVAHALVNRISRNMISQIYKGNSQIILGALRYIHRNYHRKLTLQEVSDELHVNSSYFSYLFRQEISMTFTEYLNQLRIGQACRLLSGSDLTVVEVADAVGFGDQSYFTRVFRKYKGITPHAYRKSER